jgi:hypothetical protein
LFNRLSRIIRKEIAALGFLFGKKIVKIGKDPGYNEPINKAPKHADYAPDKTEAVPEVEKV